jgi:hypothetical protein
MIDFMGTWVGSVSCLSETRLYPVAWLNIAVVIMSGKLQGPWSFYSASFRSIFQPLLIICDFLLSPPSTANGVPMTPPPHSSAIHFWTPFYISIDTPPPPPPLISWIWPWIQQYFSHDLGVMHGICITYNKQHTCTTYEYDIIKANNTLFLVPGWFNFSCKIKKKSTRKVTILIILFQKITFYSKMTILWVKKNPWLAGQFFNLVELETMYLFSWPFLLITNRDVRNIPPVSKYATLNSNHYSTCNKRWNFDQRLFCYELQLIFNTW